MRLPHPGGIHDRLRVELLVWGVDLRDLSDVELENHVAERSRLIGSAGMSTAEASTAAAVIGRAIASRSGE